MDEASINKIIKAIDSEINSYKVKPENLVKIDNPDEFLNSIKQHGRYNYFMPLLIQRLQLKNIVELGSREGGSTLCIYDGLPQTSHFTTVDILKDQRYCPDKMSSDPRVSFVFGDVSDLGIYKEIPYDINFLFTDTIHYDSQLRDEWAVYQHLLADEALFAIDDINLNDKRKLFDELPYPKWDLTKMCHTSGWGLVLYQRKESLSKEERLMRAYKASSAIWRRKALEQEKFINSQFKNRLTASAKNYMRSHPMLHKSILFLRGKT